MNYSSHKFFDDNVVQEKESWITGRINNQILRSIHIQLFGLIVVDCNDITRRCEGNYKNDDCGVLFLAFAKIYEKKETRLSTSLKLLFVFDRGLKYQSLSRCSRAYGRRPKARTKLGALSPNTLIRIISGETGYVGAILLS